jgi:hypothetical protein
VHGVSEQPLSEEELRARLEEELKKITVEDVLLQTAVTLINLGGQRLGLTPETRDTRDLGQARVAIEALRALMPVLGEREDVTRPLQDALTQLQLAYAREAEAAGGGEGDEAPPSSAPGPEQQPDAPPAAGEQARRRDSGRLWTPPGSTG